MGQAFRRAAGKLRSTSIDTSSSSAAPSSRYQNVIENQRPLIHKNNTEDGSKSNAQVSEERDPQYDAMLSQMLGRISTKPGGKPEMGEAFVVQKSKRPLPKERNTSPDSGHYEERPVTAGTLNVAQLRRIMLLHQGKADDHDGPVDVKEIAETFRVDASQLKRVFQFVTAT